MQSDSVTQLPIPSGDSEIDRSFDGLATSQMSTPVTISATSQAQTLFTTHPQLTRDNQAVVGLHSFLLSVFLSAKQKKTSTLLKAALLVSL